MQSKIIPSPSPLSALPLALEQAFYILSILQNTSHDIIIVTNFKNLIVSILPKLESLH